MPQMTSTTTMIRRLSGLLEGPCPAAHDSEDAFDDAIDAAMSRERPAEES